MSDNKSHEILLSISIPTYNRPEKLKRCLLSIIDQISDHVEIVVTDNSDTDETKYVVEEIVASTGVKINYYKNSKNIGLDANFYEGVIKSRGLYVHWLSDDDEMLPGKLKILLKVINNLKTKCSFIFLNSLGFEEKNNKREWKNTWLSEEGQAEFLNVELALSEIGSDMTFISSYCFHREGWISVSNPDKHFGTNLYLTYTLMAFLGKFREIYLLRTPIIAHRHDYTDNFHLLRPFTIELQKALISYSGECNLNRTELIKVYNAILAKLVFELIVGLKCNYFKPKGKVNYINDVIIPCWKRKVFWTKLLPAIILPKIGYSIIRKIRKVVKPVVNLNLIA